MNDVAVASVYVIISKYSEDQSAGRLTFDTKVVQKSTWHILCDQGAAALAMLFSSNNDITYNTHKHLSA